MFRASEDFVERYTNVGISGFNYRGFAKANSPVPAYYLNTRIYSCILIKNDIPFRWRGKYNEDTDLSLCALKAGWCTILFNAFLVDKCTTMRMKGGNTNELYKDNGRLIMAKSLVEQHPDVTKISVKFNRYQHHVDYSSFKKNRLIKKPNINISTGIDNYGMVLCPK